MRKMEGWTLVMCFLSATFAVPLPQHPGYINFSYEVLTPLKWYQSLVGPQLPHYGYGPMAGWIQHSGGPAMPHSHFQMHNALHQVQPHLQSFPPHPMGPMPGQTGIIPHYPQPQQHPPPPPVGEHPVHSYQPMNGVQPVHPQTGNTNQPIFQAQPQLPVIRETPLESWPVPDKTKQEEVD